MYKTIFPSKSSLVVSYCVNHCYCVIYIEKQGSVTLVIYLLGLLLLHLLHVELELFTLKNVSITSTALSRSRRDLGVDSTGGELLVKHRVELSSKLSGNASTSLGIILHFLNLLSLNLLDTDLDSIVRLIPVTERSGINLNDSRLHQSLCSPC